MTLVEALFPAQVSVSRWDLLHLLYSSENPAESERDRRELAGVQRRCMRALEELPRARVIDGADTNESVA